jgi:hypothetical protein
MIDGPHKVKERVLFGGGQSSSWSAGRGRSMWDKYTTQLLWRFFYLADVGYVTSSQFLLPEVGSVSPSAGHASAASAAAPI